ncbi:amidohydrolase family protein [Actinomadura sp. ATCC 31491]|uniref:Amidohydrolase family protein n=1 Tax=Actinomadura luzonensis TaxID=2805427 RepID=A0ABT0G3J3_9ACTN|nr:amidohydrolase family protein [Actinomadura luzonensis]MCK2219182.1 amidohydrolase family protein [Actinomadura luzonensis]
MLALRAPRLFDGHDLHHDRVVLTANGRVTAVVSGDPEDAPRVPGEPLTVVDLGEDATLLPGLIDCHVHLAFDASPDVVAALERPGLAGRMREAARAHLAAGVTTVRDLGDRGHLALELGLGLDGPEILAAGPPITTPRGHCWFLGGEAAGEQGVREAVRERAARGAHVVKMMVTGGEMTPGSHSHLLQYGPAELKAAVDEAHAHGLPITAHAHCAEGVAHALDAGFDSIEHCSFFTEDGYEVDHALIRRLASSGVVVSLTAGLVPSAVPPPPRIRARMAGISEAVRAFYAAGVRFVIGTDAGIGPPKPHGVLPYGAEMLVEHGYAPVDVLRAITSVAAGACRVAGRKGAIAPGHDADLLVVSGDPLTDITALRRPLAVYRMGRFVT